MITVSFTLVFCFILVNIAVLLVLVYAILRLLAQVIKLKEILSNDMFITFQSMKEVNVAELPELGPGSGKFWID